MVRPPPLAALVKRSLPGAPAHLDDVVGQAFSVTDDHGFKTRTNPDTVPPGKTHEIKGSPQERPRFFAP